MYFKYRNDIFTNDRDIEEYKNVSAYNIEVCFNHGNKLIVERES